MELPYIGHSSRPISSATRFHSAAVCYSAGLKTDSAVFSADFDYCCYCFGTVVAVCFRIDFDFFLPLFSPSFSTTWF